MSEAYEEILSGEAVLRRPPGRRHEVICNRLHSVIEVCVAKLPSTRLLPVRMIVQLAPGTLIRPDITLVAAATGKPWLVAEVIDNQDHHPDTVIKKCLYEDLKMPRLWIIDPRYSNVEIYHGSGYGMVLKQILANRDELTEKLLPGFQISMGALFEFVEA